MTNSKKPMIVLDVSKGLPYSYLYNPVIGQTISTHYPFVTRFRPPTRPFRVLR